MAVRRREARTAAAVGRGMAGHRHRRDIATAELVPGVAERVRAEHLAHLEDALAAGESEGQVVGEWGDPHLAPRPSHHGRAENAAAGVQPRLGRDAGGAAARVARFPDSSCHPDLALARQRLGVAAVVGSLHTGVADRAAVVALAALAVALAAALTGGTGMGDWIAHQWTVGLLLLLAVPIVGTLNEQSVRDVVVWYAVWVGILLLRLLGLWRRLQTARKMECAT